MIAVLRIVKIVLRILIPQVTKALIQKQKNLKENTHKVGKILTTSEYPTCKVAPTSYQWTQASPLTIKVGKSSVYSPAIIGS